MRGRVMVPFLSLCLLFLSRVAFPACNYNPVFSGQYRSSVLDLSVDGTNLWAATSYGVTLYDRSVDPPARVASVAIPGITRVVRTAGGVAYAASGSKISVIQRSGSSLAITGQVDTGATINDLVVLPATIYAATTAGIIQYDLFSAQNLVRSTTTFMTSSPNVLSLTLSGTTLYAADGDNSVEIFSVTIPSLPQNIGTLSSLPRSSSVKLAGGKIFVSDGQQTDLFSGTTKIGTVALGSSAFAALTNDVVFTAGNDRQLRAVDFSAVGTPIELFETALSPAGGTINRISTLQLAGGRLYAAGGDLGLLTYDVSSFTAPFPVRGYDRGATTSVFSLGTKIYVTPSTGSIIEYLQNAGGSLTQARQWSSQQQRLHDGNANGFLLSSSGATATYWTLISTTPTAVSSVTFAKPIVSAALAGNTVYAVLADKTFASADMSALNPVPTPIAIDASNPTAIARSGSALALTDLRDDGTTRVLFYATPDFTRTPKVVSVPGFATSGVALGGSTAAVFTFNGLNVIDFASATPAAKVIPSSTAALAQSLAISGSSLLEATERSLLVWDLTTLKLTRELALPSDAIAVSVSPDAQQDVATLATATGVATVAFKAASKTPSLVASVAGNNYYRKVAATADRIYLFDGRSVDLFTTISTAPHFVASVRPNAIVDFAAGETALYTLASNGVVSVYSPDGALLGQTTLSEGADAQWLSIAVANGTPWIGFAKGCLTGVCQKTTLVLDPRSLVQTATLSGAVTAVANSGSRVFALFDLPSEIRVYEAADALHPSQVASRPAEGTRTPISIAAANGTVFVLGERLYAYDAGSLNATSTQFDAWTADPSNALTYVDQRVYAESGCALVTGRTFAVQPIGEAAIATLPAAVKSIAAQGDRLLLLTDYSLEIWSKSGTAPKPPRRRAAR
jgi:hypothetical protein